MIAIRSVVTRSVPLYAVVAGSPARVVRLRFRKEVIKALLQIRRWEWPGDRIREAVPVLSSKWIEEFPASYAAQTNNQQPRKARP